MKYIIKDNDGNILLETDKKEEIDFFIDDSVHNEFYGFYWENNDMIISTGGFDVIIRYE